MVKQSKGNFSVLSMTSTLQGAMARFIITVTEPMETEL